MMKTEKINESVNKLINEMMRDIEVSLKDRVYDTLKSGAIDQTNPIWKEGPYILPKLLLIDALRHTANQYMPSDSFILERKFRNELKNLKHF